MSSLKLEHNVIIVGIIIIKINHNYLIFLSSQIDMDSCTLPNLIDACEKCDSAS